VVFKWQTIAKYSLIRARAHTHTHARTHTHMDLKILQWKPVGLSQNKKSELYINLVKHNVQVFAIVEANIMKEKLVYYQFNC